MNKVVEKLFELAEKDYQKFNQNLIQGGSPIIGVRIPTLRKIAKEIIKSNEVNDFFDNYEGLYFEEKLIKGVIIASCEEFFIKYGEDYLNELDSWCLVDTYSNSCKFIEKNKEKYWEYANKLLDSDKEFVIRLGYVLILYYYLSDEYIDDVIKLCKRKYNYYYVNMAISWAISESYINYKDKITALLEEKVLSEFVQEKSIDKIYDSSRVSFDEKSRLRELK